MELLENLTQCTSPSGREDEVRMLIEKEMQSCTDEIYTDALGNLICHKKGSNNNKKLMLAAHMDEIGIIVIYIDDNGFLRFSNVGGVRDFNCVNRSVIFQNGVSGVISYENKEKPGGFDKMYIDIGAKNREEAEKKVKIGDMAAFVGGFEIMGDRIATKAADDRTGCYALIKAMQQAKCFAYDVYAVFTAQEEVGLRGAKTAAFAIEPDIGIAIDVSNAGDTPNSADFSIILGKGPGIKIKDASFLINRTVRELLLNCAEKNNIPYQLEASHIGGTDAGAMQFAANGVAVGTVSIPTRYIHSPFEIIDKNDLLNTVNLIKAVIEAGADI